MPKKLKVGKHKVKVGKVRKMKYGEKTSSFTVADPEKVDRTLVVENKVVVLKAGDAETKVELTDKQAELLEKNYPYLVVTKLV